jgi:hypothetical protein
MGLIKNKSFQPFSARHKMIEQVVNLSVKWFAEKLAVALHCISGEPSSPVEWRKSTLF